MFSKETTKKTTIESCQSCRVYLLRLETHSVVRKHCKQFQLLLIQIVENIYKDIWFILMTQFV